MESVANALAYTPTATERVPCAPDFSVNRSKLLLNTAPGFLPSAFMRKVVSQSAQIPYFLSMSFHHLL